MLVRSPKLVIDINNYCILTFIAKILYSNFSIRKKIIMLSHQPLNIPTQLRNETVLVLSTEYIMPNNIQDNAAKCAISADIFKANKQYTTENY